MSTTLIWLLPFILFCIVSGQQSTFSKKCRGYVRPAIFFNESCFVATDEKYRTTEEEWIHLAASCNHFPTYRRRLAFVYTPEQIRQLVFHDVVKPNTSLIIGSKRILPSNCTLDCDGCPSSEQFYYTDKHLKLHGAVNRNLWLRKQPDNRGPNRSLPENLMALEHGDKAGKGSADQVGFNDIDGQSQALPLLCEYRDTGECPYQMIAMSDGGCLGLWHNHITPKEAIAFCRNITNGNNRGELPSIHDVETSFYLADMARRLIINNKWFNGGQTSESFDTYWPVLFGLVFDGSKWTNSDNSPIDFFHWWSLENPHHRLFANPTKGHKYAYLMSRTNGDNGLPTFGYWANMFNEKQKIPYFFCSVKQVRAD